MEQNKFRSLFEIEKPIIGMIHLSGYNKSDKVKRALKELILYQEEGISGAIIEDYHGMPSDVYETLKQSSTLDLKIIRGVNILREPYSAFELADKFGAGFIQFDSVQTRDLISEFYNSLRKNYPNIMVLGGIEFKYIPPTGNPLEIDLKEGKARCDAVVTTGSATGIETPIEKLKNYKELLEDFPLIVGAGVDLSNVYEQLKITDGAIIGSYFKPEKETLRPIDRKKVKDLMDVVKEIREL